MQHTGFRIHLIRSPSPAKSAHNHLVQQKWLEHRANIARCKEFKQRLSLVQLVITTIGAVNLLNDLLAPVLPASVEEFAYECTSRQEPMCPHIIAIRLTTNTCLGLNRSASHLRQIQCTGHGLIWYVGQQQIMNNVEHVLLSEALGQCLDILGRRCLIVNGIRILNSGYELIRQRIFLIRENHAHNLLIGLDAHCTEQNKERECTAHHRNRHTNLTALHHVQSNTTCLLGIRVQRHYRCIGSNGVIRIRLLLRI